MSGAKPRLEELKSIQIRFSCRCHKFPSPDPFSADFFWPFPKQPPRIKFRAPIDHRNFGKKGLVSWPRSQKFTRHAQRWTFPQQVTQIFGSSMLAFLCFLRGFTCLSTRLSRPTTHETGDLSMSSTNLHQLGTVLFCFVGVGKSQ